jgi:hypothetical protein
LPGGCSVAELPGVASAVDFDVHGFVGIRVLDATDAEADAIRHQLGPIETPLEREPDLVIRFVDAVPAAGTLRILGIDEVGFSDNAFLILRGRGHARVRIVMPLDRIGQPSVEIVAEHGALGIPLLVALVNLCALGNGVLPLHASAFVHDGLGVLVTGWAKGGKTEALLAFMARGARYVGDEWIYIDPATRQMHGIPEPMRLWNWHLRSVPEYGRRVAPAARLRLRALDALVATMDAAAHARLAPSPARRLLRRALPIARRQLSVQVPPQRLFGDAAVQSAELQRVVLLGNHDLAQIAVRVADADEIGRRMTHSLMYERSELLSYYQRFRFAFPDRANPLLEGADTRAAQLLSRCLMGVPAIELLHPYPVDIPALYNALAPVL